MLFYLVPFFFYSVKLFFFLFKNAFFFMKDLFRLFEFFFLNELKLFKGVLIFFQTSRLLYEIN